MKKIICYLLISALTSGCASIIYRTENSNIASDNIYPGVRADVELMGACSSGDSSYELASAQLNALSKVLFVLALIDIPLSAVLDTILLPFDIFYPRGGDASRNLAREN